MTGQPASSPAGVPPGDPFYGALAEDDPAELYENAPCAYLSTLPDGTIVKVNATLVTWTGWRREEMVGTRRFSSRLAPGDRIFYETHFAPRLRMQGQVREIAVEVVCASGARLAVLVNAVLKRDAAGQPVMIRIALFDATERRRYEQELLVARRRAQESEARATALAKVLQASFLPAEITPIPGLDIAGAYRPFGDGNEVGGDFYDVIDTGAQTCGIVIGDVCGKGPGSAVITLLARSSARAESLRSSSPSQVLAGMHQALVRYYPNHFCTAAFLALAPSAGAVHARFCAAGHPLALVVRGDGRVETLGSPGSMLGMSPYRPATDASATLAEGDAVMAYTDGVSEARRGGEFFGEEGIVRVLQACVGAAAQEVADAVVAASLAFQDGVAGDDVAVVVARVGEGAVG